MVQRSSTTRVLEVPRDVSMFVVNRKDSSGMIQHDKATASSCKRAESLQEVERVGLQTYWHNEEHVALLVQIFELFRVIQKPHAAIRRARVAQQYALYLARKILRHFRIATSINLRWGKVWNTLQSRYLQIDSEALTSEKLRGRVSKKPPG